jgi:hypothetical protein
MGYSLYGQNDAFRSLRSSPHSIVEDHAGALLDHQRNDGSGHQRTPLQIGVYRHDIREYPDIWSAACLQAKSDDDSLVCANVFGLWWSLQLLAMMDSARSLPY